MDLDHITYSVCPTCGSMPIAETKDRQHCNGHWNESRRFACGFKVEYSPNFKKESITTNCPQSNEMITFKQKREVAKQKLEKYILRLDVDDSFKLKVMDVIQYL